jgi:hypothetical protein
VLLLRNREDEEAETEEGGGADIPLGLPGSKPIEIAKLGRSAQTLLAYEEYAEPWGASVAGHCHVVLGRVSEKQAIMRHQKPWGEAPRKASGVLMANRASSNYFHWMLETLAKVKYLEECGVRNEAFIIPAGMPIQHYQALQAAQGKDPSTWAYFHPLTGLDMDQLTVMSPPLSMSEDPGANARDTFAVYAEAVKDLSERILRNLAVTDGGRRRKIYLGRKGRIRGLANEPEIARFMVRHGFEIVYPEKLSFEEQVRTFRDASCVAGPSGAALTNIMFCRPGTVTLSLNADYHSENVVFSQIAESVGGKVWQITGPFVPRGSRERMLGAVDVLHQPYTVPVETVARALSEIDR